MMQTEQSQEAAQPQQQQLMLQNSSGSLSFSSNMSREDEEMSRSALSTFRAKEEEIERKKMEVREKVQAQLGRVEEETKRLATIREELEGLSDPMRKDVSQVRKKIDAINKELKPLGHTCQKKEKEYRDALEAFNEKNREKVQLITKLMERAPFKRERWENLMASSGFLSLAERDGRGIWRLLQERLGGWSRVCTEGGWAIQLRG